MILLKDDVDTSDVLCDYCGKVIFNQDWPTEKKKPFCMTRKADGTVLHHCEDCPK